MLVYLIAGEASGDILGARLMEALRAIDPDTQFAGVGGPLMREQGLESLFEMQELSVMGLVEVLPKYRHLKRRIAETADDILSKEPDILVTIDSPDFCLRVAKTVRGHLPLAIVHYVSPTIWAWRPKRAQKLVGLVDHVMALFPFEPTYLHQAGVSCSFVGHPVADAPTSSLEEQAAFSEREGLGQGPALLLLPGSRKGEITRMLPVFREACKDLARDLPDLPAILPIARGYEGLVQELTENWPLALHLLAASDCDDFAALKRTAFGRADVALAASGTVALELAAEATPMVSAYRMNPITFAIMKSMALTDTANLINLVSNTRTVPEFLGPDCTAPALVSAVREQLRAPEAQKNAMALTMERLKAPDGTAAETAAHTVFNVLNGYRDFGAG